ncbi:DapH/DapD/GlmU-related protein [Pseudomonas gingeri]|uniref:DapH/DapD/GlmU-related protein n=1 Tax=Pseudomonas gingeri TaxID=117681 RepID=UPI00352916E6
MTVGAGCWLGAKSLVLGGVSIGEGAIVAAGSVVTRDVAPNTMVAGVPAVLKRQLS